MPILTVPPAETNPTTLDFLRRRIPAAPVAYLRQLLRHGKVRRASVALEETDLLAAGDEVHLPERARLADLLTAPLRPALEILYESREILIVDKPAGVAVHRGRGHEADNLADRVAALLRERGERFMAAPVQRLDVETSGPVLFGKGRRACGELGKLLQERRVDKRYLALVRGETAAHGDLVSPVAAKGKVKESSAAFTALSRNAQASLLLLELHSGRQHQLRVQLAAAGHPIFGDRRYGGPLPRNLPRLFLHCCRLAFIDPFGGRPLEIVRPLPADLADILPHCNLAAPAVSALSTTGTRIS